MMGALGYGRGRRPGGIPVGVPGHQDLPWREPQGLADADRSKQVPRTCSVPGSPVIPKCLDYPLLNAEERGLGLILDLPYNQRVGPDQYALGYRSPGSGVPCSEGLTKVFYWRTSHELVITIGWTSRFTRLRRGGLDHGLLIGQPSSPGCPGVDGGLPDLTS